VHELEAWHGDLECLVQRHLLRLGLVAQLDVGSPAGASGAIAAERSGCAPEQVIQPDELAALRLRSRHTRASIVIVIEWSAVAESGSTFAP
jgi:hypothetical protein